MKFWFCGDGCTWCSERFHYAAEQTMLTLFPNEKPEYPQTPPPVRSEESAAVFTLRREKEQAVLHTRLFWKHAVREGEIRFPSIRLEESPTQVYHTIQQALKQSFYEAGIALRGQDLPWGSLTGVRPTKIPTRAIWRGRTPAQAEQELEEVYHVSPLRRRLAVECAQESVNIKRTLVWNEVSIYVGIPFCPSRCAYCSFISAAGDRNLSLIGAFVEALEREIEAVGDLLRDTQTSVRCVYLGGGTPTTLSVEQLERVLDKMIQCLPVSGCSEFTVEAGRPDTISPEKLHVLAAHGVNRVSVNPQSMHDTVLREIGRCHTADDIRKTYREVREWKTFAVNMDLIAGLPGDSTAGFQDSLRQVIELAPENITVHTLTLKKGSRLREQTGGCITDTQVEEMLNTAWLVLRKAGYAPYYLYRQKYMSGAFENVGWTRPGFAGVYNIIMMEELQTVLALGGGGVSKLIDPDTEKLERRSNPKYPQEYLRDIEKICAAKADMTGFLRKGESYGLPAQGNQCGCESQSREFSGEM